MFIQNKNVSITPPPARAPVRGRGCSFLGCMVSRELSVNRVLGKQESCQPSSPCWSQDLDTWPRWSLIHADKGGNESQQALPRGPWKTSSSKCRQTLVPEYKHPCPCRCHTGHIQIPPPPPPLTHPLSVPLIPFSGRSPNYLSLPSLT